MATVMIPLSEHPPVRIGRAAKVLGVSKNQVRKWIDSGLLRTVRPDGLRDPRVVWPDVQRLAREMGVAI